MPAKRYWITPTNVLSAASTAFASAVSILQLKSEGALVVGGLAAVGVALVGGTWWALAQATEKAAKDVEEANRRAFDAERHAAKSDYALEAMGRLYMTSQEWQEGKFDELMDVVRSSRPVVASPGTGGLIVEGHAPKIEIGVGGIPSAEAFGTVSVTPQEKEELTKKILALTGTARIPMSGRGIGQLTMRPEQPEARSDRGDKPE